MKKINLEYFQNKINKILEDFTEKYNNYKDEKITRRINNEINADEYKQYKNALVAYKEGKRIHYWSHIIALLNQYEKSKPENKRQEKSEKEIAKTLMQRGIFLFNDHDKIKNKKFYFVYSLNLQDKVKFIENIIKINDSELFKAAIENNFYENVFEKYRELLFKKQTKKSLTGKLFTWNTREENRRIEVMINFMIYYEKQNKLHYLDKTFCQITENFKNHINAIENNNMKKQTKEQNGNNREKIENTMKIYQVFKKYLDQEVINNKEIHKLDHMRREAEFFYEKLFIMTSNKPRENVKKIHESNSIKKSLKI